MLKKDTTRVLQYRNHRTMRTSRLSAGRGSGSGPGRGYVQVRDVHDRGAVAFFDHQLNHEATRMAFPARDRDAVMAHWATIRADERVVMATILGGGGAPGHLVADPLLDRGS